MKLTKLLMARGTCLLVIAMTINMAQAQIKLKVNKSLPFEHFITANVKATNNGSIIQFDFKQDKSILFDMHSYAADIQLKDSHIFLSGSHSRINGIRDTQFKRTLIYLDRDFVLRVRLIYDGCVTNTFYEYDHKSKTFAEVTDWGISSAISIKEPYLKAFPNPSSGHITIESPGYQMNALVVHDWTGKAVLKREVMNDISQLNLGDIPNGIYVLNVQTNKGVLSQKLIVSR